MKGILTAAFIAVFLQTPGKLEIKDVQVGKGEASKAGDILTVHYTGKLTNGNQFDSSVDRDPFQFIVGAGQVIKGWDQGMIGMKPGGKRQLTIPSDLAYGDNGAGDIPPNSTLKFEVELIKADRIKHEILTKGKGDATAKGGDSCELHVDLTDHAGKKLWSSREGAGEVFPITIGRTGLIKGFTAGVIGMKQGEIRKITVPPEYGYGAKGQPPAIAPNTTLIFKIEMIKLVTAKEIN